MPTDLPRSTPAEQGVDATGIDAFIEATAKLPGVELHSLMVLRHGHVVAEHWWPPYAPQTPHLLYSLSKSFASTALGLAVAEGLADLDATVLSYFPEYDAQVTDERSRRMLVRHITAMASGHTEDTFDHAVATGDTVLGFLQIPPQREPGTVFAYNQSCTYTIGEIVRRVSGGSLIDFLRPRLFEPLGITTYGWRTDWRGFEQGFSGLHTTTESIAKLGQLYLRDGEWDGRQLLPAAWVAEATTSHVATGEGHADWDQGYGFQFWCSRHGYRGDGAYGQYMLVLPEADAVVAITSQSSDMQAVLDAAWTHLLPALTAGGGPAGPWAAPQTALAGPDFTAITLRPGPDNELDRLRTVDLRSAEIALHDAGPELVVALGAPGAWTTSGAVSAAWTLAAAGLEVDLVFVETPHRLHLTLDLSARLFTARWETQPLGPLPLADEQMPRPA